MEPNGTKPPNAVENPRIDRRRVIQALGLTAAASFAATVSPKTLAYAAGDGKALMQQGATGFKAVAFNHIDYRVPNYTEVRDFYVNFFGMKLVWDDGKQCSVEFGDPPNALYIRSLTKPLERPAGVGPSANWDRQMGNGNVDHLAFSIENFQLNSVKAELTRRGLNPQPDGPLAWSIKDPSGFPIQICATKGVFPGQASPTAKESDGTKNLNRIPEPDGKGFKAYSVNHLALQVPNVDECRDFYTGLLGMKIIYYKPGDVFGVDLVGGPVCFLRFGPHVIYLRKSKHPENKPYVSHFALEVENYNQVAVKAELERRGYKPEPMSRFAWTIDDPAGLQIDIAGKGLPEHIAADCNGGSALGAGCPGGKDK
jgi:catechol 2,3-dioxygenase-like lactoylglutathione lyase family enzyme